MQQTLAFRQPHKLRAHTGRSTPHNASYSSRRSLVPASASADAQASAGASTSETSPIEVLRAAAKTQRVPPKQVLRAMLEVESLKLKPDGFLKYIADPKARWRLIYSADSKAAVAAKKGDASASGFYFPIPACQKYDTDPNIMTNGIFLGGFGYLIFAGPFDMQGKKLQFDNTFMTIGLGPFKWTFPLKKDGMLVDVIAKTSSDEQILKTKLPFFLFAYADEDFMVARGTSGGVAIWANADPEWQAKAGVLRVYQ